MTEKNEVRIVVRDASASDAEEIYQMVCDLNHFQKLPHDDIDKKDFLQLTGFFSPHTTPYFHLYVAEVTDNKTGETTLVGYAMDYFLVKMTKKGHTLFVEHVYVKPEFRGMSIGHLLFKETAIRAKEHNSLFLKLECLDWNPARKFYEDRGGKLDGIRVRPDAVTYIFDRVAISDLVNGKYDTDKSQKSSH